MWEGEWVFVYVYKTRLWRDPERLKISPRLAAGMRRAVKGSVWVERLCCAERYRTKTIWASEISSEKQLETPYLAFHLVAGAYRNATACAESLETRSDTPIHGYSCDIYRP